MAYRVDERLNLTRPLLPFAITDCALAFSGFLLKDRCSLSDQISFILASSRRAFILAMRDRDRANKDEIEIFVFSVTSNDFPHYMLLLTFVPARSAARAQPAAKAALP